MAPDTPAATTPATPATPATPVKKDETVQEPQSDIARRIQEDRHDKIMAIRNALDTLDMEDINKVSEFVRGLSSAGGETKAKGRDNPTQAK